ncbi:hypothetical protein D0869_10917 [Hortaea werneckii]|uniref:Uncharacterized protein n=1 Tax=Hortaea werneckii TaxID=91943 RepID=A0A3M6WCC3_HORWE|nr:hypothetical protein KC324_g10595 [Hortaea werneckii]KAI7582819.1 hypothetical protein KC316_g7646 [Hortaea werneckii]RMX76214.1 hypothetical protein D0869_10917 [Hortaea werneckii]RMX97845.1 hypothetical protein D0868_10430 [Hortaea werneckii]
MLCVRTVGLRQLPRRRHDALRQIRNSASQADNQSTSATSNGTRTFRQRQHGNDALPLPPFLDPIAIEAKTRHKRPKTYQDEQEKTEFQRELEANPFANALATPVRQCAFTQALLPSHFLIPMVAHITPPPEENESGKRQASTIHLSPDINLDVPRELRSPSRSYVIADREVFKTLSSRNKWPLIASERMKKWVGLRLGRDWQALKVNREWTWDKKIDEVILEKLRDNVGVKMREAQQAGLLVHEDAVGTGDVAFGLRAGNTTGDISPGQLRGKEVYDMTVLLGDEKWQGLVGAQSVDLVVLGASSTQALQQALLRLDHYMSSTSG